MLHNPEAVDDLALDLYAAQCAATRFRSKAISRAGGLPDALDRYGGPVLLLWGEHDVTAAPAEAAPRLAAGRADRSWHIVPGAGHWVQYEKPGEVSALLMDWFRANGQAGGA